MNAKVISIDHKSKSWCAAPNGEPRGFIKSHVLDELWLHTGTACNLACPFCLEGSKPGDNRLQLMRFNDARPLINEALSLGVKQFSFTGGEPFINKDIIRILEYCLQHRPCLVLTNATEPLLKRLKQLEPLRHAAQPLHFRVSLDHFDYSKHDIGRGDGMFAMALKGLKKLHAMDFAISVANQVLTSIEADVTARQFAKVFKDVGLPANMTRIEFPEFHPPASEISAPQITQRCMTTFHTKQSRRNFMCAFSRMAVKINGQTKVYACTLVDDDPDYALGETLTESLQVPVSMKHHRCYSCFQLGASCSEMNLNKAV